MKCDKGTSELVIVRRKRKAGDRLFLCLFGFTFSDVVLLTVHSTGGRGAACAPRNSRIDFERRDE